MKTIATWKSTNDRGTALPVLPGKAMLTGAKALSLPRDGQFAPQLFQLSSKYVANLYHNCPLITAAYICQYLYTLALKIRSLQLSMLHGRSKTFEANLAAPPLRSSWRGMPCVRAPGPTWGPEASGLLDL